MTLDIYTAIDVYRVIAFALNNDGTFDLTEDDYGGVQDLYQGVEFAHPTSFDVSFGAPRQIPVVAQGQVQATFLLPSIEAKTGILRTAYDKLTLNAMLSGVSVDTIGGGKYIPEDTDKSGTEKLVALLLSQLQAKDDDGSLMWRNDLVHRATIVPSPTSYADTPMVKEYNLAMSRSSKRFWGETYTLVTHGCTEASKDVGITSNKLNIGVWMGNGSYTTFNLPSTKKANDTANAKVWQYSTGTARAGSWDASTDAQVFTPTVLLPDGEVLVILYEYD